MKETEIQLITDFFYEEKSKFLTKTYLEKYWLSEKEWLENWLSLKTNIFYEDTSYNQEFFRKKYNTVIQYNKNPFTKENFLKFQKEILLLGETEFVIIENEKIRPIFDNEDLPILKFKYPVSILWEQLNNNGVKEYEISKEIFQDMYRNFFIFGKSQKWGIYVATENDVSFTVIGIQ